MITLNELAKKFAHAALVFDGVLSAGSYARLLKDGSVEGDDPQQSTYTPGLFTMDLGDGVVISCYLPIMKEPGSLLADELELSLSSHVVLTASEDLDPLPEKMKDKLPTIVLNFKKGLFNRGTEISLKAKFKRQDEPPEGIAQILDLMSKRFSQKAGELGL